MSAGHKLLGETPVLIGWDRHGVSCLIGSYVLSPLGLAGLILKFREESCTQDQGFPCKLCWPILLRRSWAEKRMTA
jgi:hypothetical protein